MIEAIDFARIPAQERLAHYGLLFALAAADGSFDADEKNLILNVLETDGLDSADRDRLRRFVVAPPPLDECFAVLEHAGDELRFGTMVGLVDIAYADGVLTEREEAALEEARERLGINQVQLQAIDHFIDELASIDLDGSPSVAEQRAFASRAEAVAAAGIPLSAVAFSATVGRVLRYGPESLQNALGIGLGKIPGTPISVLVGANISVSVSELLGRRDANDPIRPQTKIRRERLQDALEHLQATITEIGQDIEALQGTGGRDAEILVLDERRSGLKQLARTRRSALEDS